LDFHGCLSAAAKGRSMRNITENNITDAVLSRMQACKSPRDKEVMSLLVSHLHAFIKEARITEAEWMQGIEFLTATGQMCNDKRQEFVLLSDTLGVSMLTTCLNNTRSPGVTESTVFGPFHVLGAPLVQDGANIAGDAPGVTLAVRASVKSLSGEPVVGALVDIWQADDDGFYDVQYEGRDTLQARARMRTNEQGCLNFRTILPAPYPVPTDGPVGKMLLALGCHPWRPAHVHFMIQAEGYETLITHVFRDGDEYLDSDAVFGVRSSLIGDFKHHATGSLYNGQSTGNEFFTLDFDFVLQPAAKASAQS
jgi:hydroxyquinol 1,2-dioxygenase